MPEQFKWNHMEQFMNTSRKRIWKTSDKSEAPLKKAAKHEKIALKSDKCSYTTCVVI